MPSFQIRAATDEDDRTWSRLRAALWPDCPAERHAVERELYQRSPGVIALAVDDDDHAFGFAEVSIRREHVSGTRSDVVPYLEGWYVDASWRGQGVGRALIEYISTWARQAGYLEIASDAEIENTLSQKAHQQLGFREVDRTITYLKDL